MEERRAITSEGSMHHPSGDPGGARPEAPGPDVVPGWLAGTWLDDSVGAVEPPPIPPPIEHPGP
eukprot:7838883-Pyramimonas_sp.AAC.1